MSEKGDGQYLYVMDKDGVLRPEPAYKHYPKKKQKSGRIREFLPNILILVALSFFFFILFILSIAFTTEKEAKQ